MKTSLVSQTSEDGTGADLLPLLQEECTQKIKSGIIKKFKPLPPISEEDLEFEVPSTWTTIRLGSVCQLLDISLLLCKIICDVYRISERYYIIRGQSWQQNDSHKLRQ